MEDCRPSPAAYLPDDLVTQILTRVPAKSLCRFNCVSRSWRALISDIAHCASLTQAPSGVFFSPEWESKLWGFVSLPTPSPLPPVDLAVFLTAPSGEDTELLDSCNGLLLVRCCSPSRNNGVAFYVVCNPATGERVTLPQPSTEPGSFNDDEQTKVEHAVLAFDPATSSHDFFVFQLVEEEHMYNPYITAVEIYSSRTGTWVRRECWSRRGRYLGVFSGHTFYFNGFQHFSMEHFSMYCGHIGLVDTTGQTWRNIDVKFPGCSNIGFIGPSQGRLLYIVHSLQGPDAWVIYVLEDHNRDEWTFKHRVSKQALFGTPLDDSGWEPIYSVAAIHPECDLIFFFDRRQKKFMSYDMSIGNTTMLIGDMKIAADRLMGLEGAEKCGTLMQVVCSESLRWLHSIDNDVSSYRNRATNRVGGGYVDFLKNKYSEHGIVLTSGLRSILEEVASKVGFVVCANSTRFHQEDDMFMDVLNLYKKVDNINPVECEQIRKHVGENLCFVGGSAENVAGSISSTLYYAINMLVERFGVSVLDLSYCRMNRCYW
ncbi:hypothetical protein EJB05_02607, partial [Eragrostis curvula]